MYVQYSCWIGAHAPLNVERGEEPRLIFGDLLHPSFPVWDIEWVYDPRHSFCTGHRQWSTDPAVNWMCISAQVAAHPRKALPVTGGNWNEKLEIRKQLFWVAAKGFSSFCWSLVWVFRRFLSEEYPMVWDGLAGILRWLSGGFWWYGHLGVML